MSKLKDQRKLDNLCIDCGKPVYKERTKCFSHLNRDKHYYLRRKANKICVRCYKPISTSKYTYCYNCRKEHSKKEIEYQRELIRLKLCLGCKSTIGNTRFVRCQQCRDKRSKWCRDRKAKKLVNSE